MTDPHVRIGVTPGYVGPSVVRVQTGSTATVPGTLSAGRVVRVPAGSGWTGGSGTHHEFDGTVSGLIRVDFQELPPFPGRPWVPGDWEPIPFQPDSVWERCDIIPESAIWLFHFKSSASVGPYYESHSTSGDPSKYSTKTYKPKYGTADAYPHETYNESVVFQDRYAEDPDYYARLVRVDLTGATVATGLTSASDDMPWEVVAFDTVADFPTDIYMTGGTVIASGVGDATIASGTYDVTDGQVVVAIRVPGLLAWMKDKANPGGLIYVGNLCNLWLQSLSFIWSDEL